jgi:hypothetical protein
MFVLLLLSLFICSFSTEVRYQGYITWYGFDDNDDGSGHHGTSVISDPCIHQHATEDLGTYDHPSTFAGATTYTNFKRCDKLYIPKFRKYFVMEDTCVECATDERKGLIHVDLYMGQNFLQGQHLIDCEDGATSGATNDIIIKNPNPNYLVYSPKEFINGVCNVKTFSSTPVTNTTTSDPTCQNGIKGSGANHSIVCCSLTCGKCGGTGCSLRPGGSAKCCSNNILASGISCKSSTAPCIVN